MDTLNLTGAGDATYGPQNFHSGNNVENDHHELGEPYDSFESVVFSDDDEDGETIYSGGENYGYHVNSIESSWNYYLEEVIPELVSGGENYGNVEYELKNDPNPMHIGVPFDSFDSIVFSDDDEDGDIIAKYSREWKEIVKTAFEKGYVAPPHSPLTPSDSEASYESDEDESKVVETYFQRNASTLDIYTKEKNTYESDGQREACFQRSATTTRDIFTKEKNTLSSDRLAAKFRKQHKHSSNSLSMAEKRKNKEADVLRRATTEQSEGYSKNTTKPSKFSSMDKPGKQ